MRAEEPYIERGYRGIIEPAGLDCYHVVEGQSDLLVCTEGNLREKAAASLASCRSDLEGYLRSHPEFGTSFSPLPVSSAAPDIVKEMAVASEIFNVGPMASVAGAVARYVGLDLLKHSRQVIVENGGDLFLAGGKRRKVRIFAGERSQSVDIIVEDRPEGLGLCTSSSTVGPSVSLGEADAVTVLAETATIADAAATALGNRVGSPEEISDALELAKKYDEVLGAVIVVGGSVGAWGKIEIA
ncbi:MAG: UPF0280 family protein [Actinobacteria bacterium]|nr:UPF0280 family protein [Actinomycetota bacterium]